MSEYWEDSKLFLSKVGWETKPMADNLMVKRCIYCNDEKWKFGIAKDRPVWKCHHCDKSGNLRQLAESLGLSTGYIVSPMEKPYTKPEGVSETVAHLREFPTVIEHLKSRGFTGEIAQRFKLGAESKYDADWLIIPHIVKGEILNAKYRAVTGEKKFRRWPGAKSILFNQGSISEKEVLVTEGEMDCMSVNAAYGDQYAVVGATGGAKHFDPGWIDLLNKTRKIYMCYDRDEVGQIGAKDLARRLGYDRCWNIILPEGYNDVNDLFSEDPNKFKEKFEKLKSEAKRFEIQGIQSAGSLLHRVFSTHEVDKNVSPWPSLNSLVDISPGHLVVLTADPKAGKTSMALEWLRHRVNTYREPVLFYCLDMKPDSLVLKTLQLEFNVSKDTLLKNREEYLKKGEQYFNVDSKWYMCGKFWDNKEDYFKLIRESVKRYGFKWICFDHFHWMIQSLNYATQEQANLAREFKRLAEETETTVILIAQPNKRGVSNSSGPLLATNLSGSVILSAAADYVITLTRRREEVSAEGETESSFVPETFVLVDMTRWSGGGGRTLYFHGETQKFTELPDSDIMEKESGVENEEESEEERRKEGDPFS